MKAIEDISGYEQRNDFYEPVRLMLTIKSFDLQAIRKRYLASKNNKSGKAGSVERREVSTGGIVLLTIEDGKISEQEVLVRLKEPRGIAEGNNILGLAAEDTVYLLTDKVRELHNPWFSYIHTIDFKQEKMLVASSGLDCIFEYDINSLEPTYEWFAWEHGFNQAIDPKTGETIILTRNAEEAKQLPNAKLIDKPKEQVLPTAMRAAFINSVSYDYQNPGHMLATFFHEGAVYRINMETGKAERVLEDLKNPHGGRNYLKAYMATSTGTGEVVVGDIEEQTRYSFKHLDGKPQELLGMEWLQNSLVHQGMTITIDSNRCSFVIYDPREKLYSRIPYDDNWAVQDMISFEGNDQQLEMIRRLG